MKKPHHIMKKPYHIMINNHIRKLWLSILHTPIKKIKESLKLCIVFYSSIILDIVIRRLELFNPNLISHSNLEFRDSSAAICCLSSIIWSSREGSLLQWLVLSIWFSSGHVGLFSSVSSCISSSLWRTSSLLGVFITLGWDFCRGNTVGTLFW